MLLPQILREMAAMTGDVSVLGLQNHLAVWNQKRLQERLFKKEPFTDEDGQDPRGIRDLMWSRDTSRYCSPRRWRRSP